MYIEIYQLLKQRFSKISVVTIYLQKIMLVVSKLGVDDVKRCLEEGPSVNISASLVPQLE